MGAKNCENEHGRFRHISGLNYVQKRAKIRRFETGNVLIYLWLISRKLWFMINQSNRRVEISIRLGIIMKSDNLFASMWRINSKFLSKYIIAWMLLRPIDCSNAIPQQIFCMKLISEDTWEVHKNSVKNKIFSHLENISWK